MNYSEQIAEALGVGDPFKKQQDFLYNLKNERISFNIQIEHVLRGIYYANIGNDRELKQRLRNRAIALREILERIDQYIADYE